MKHTLLALLLLATAHPCTSLAATVRPHELTLTVRNPLDLPRTDAPVVIRLADVKGLGFQPAAAVVRLNGQPVPAQIDDLDQDGQPDELVFLSTIGPKATLSYAVTLLPQAPPTTEGSPAPRLHAELMLDDRGGAHPAITAIEAPGASNLYPALYHHGPAIESELVAYRIYFDHRQNIDLYAKRLPRLEIPTTHFYTSAPQLNDESYGCDVLWAGQSIGCGTLRPWNAATSSVGDWRDVAIRRQRILCSGPVRTIIRMDDLGARLSGGTADVSTTYTLYAGHRDLEVRATLLMTSSATSADPQLCTGLQKIGTTAVVAEGLPQGLYATWGTDYPEQSSEANKALYAPESVGMALYVPAEARATTHDLPLHQVVGLRTRPSDDAKARDARRNRTAAQRPALSARRSTTTRRSALRPADGQRNRTTSSRAPILLTTHYHVSFTAAKETFGYPTAESWFHSLPDWKKEIDTPLQVRIR